jgi:acetyltransferase
MRVRWRSWLSRPAAHVGLHSDSRYESAEYAILLRSDLKGRGLGWALMQLLIEYARSEGLKNLSGMVLRENTSMLTMCRELRFEVKSDPRDASVANVSLDLATPQAAHAISPAVVASPIGARQEPS